MLPKFYAKDTKPDFLLAAIIGFFLLSFCTSCRVAYKSSIQDYKKVFASLSSDVPDYSNPICWAAHPGIRDLSDSFPTALAYEKRDTIADVFFLHPTTFLENKKKPKAWNASIKDASLNARTDYSTILYQASVFNASCRIFAPRYRQAHIAAFYSKDTATSRKAFALAYDDIKNAFEYYLKYENKGRPIIIASHSQGTLHAARLLKDFFEDKPLYAQLVVAYLWGMPIPPEYFKSIPLCEDSAQTNCLLSWRLYQKGYIPEIIEKEKFNALVVNPITWNTDSTYISSVYHKGAVLFNFNKLYAKTHGAKINKGIVWIDRPKFPFSFLYTRKNYHAGDINLFYVDIRNNIKQRIKKFYEHKN
jgi:hypothetical protein